MASRPALSLLADRRGALSIAGVLLLALSAQARRIEPFSTSLGSTAFQNHISQLASDAAGNLYAFEPMTNRVFKIPPSGVAAVILNPSGDGAGNTFGCDGFPCSMLVLPSGDVFVSASESDNVFHVDPAGVITEVLDATGDGLGNVLEAPNDLGVDTGGNLFVHGRRSNNVFRVSPGGIVTHVADVPDTCLTPDGAGNMYFVSGSAVRRHEPDGTITTILDASGDGTHPLAGITCPAADGAGNVWVSGLDSQNVFRVTPAGVVTQVLDASGDGLGNSLLRPGPPVFDSAGVAYVPDGYGRVQGQVFRVEPSGSVSLLTPAPHLAGLFVDAADTLYVFNDLIIWEVAPFGRRKILDRAGDGVRSFSPTEAAAILPTPDRVFVGAVLDATYHVVEVRTLCDPAPRSGCRVPTAPRASTLVVKDVANDAKDQVSWKWTKGEATDVADFAPPQDLDFNFCLYGAGTERVFEASVLEDSACGDGCWSARGSTGFRLLDRTLRAPDGMLKMVLRAGIDGRAKIALKARGELIPEGLTLPATALPIVAQLQASNGECWEATYDAATVRKNTDTKLVAKAPS